MKQVVINLRPKAQADSLNAALRVKGLEVVCFPTLCIAPLEFAMPQEVDWIALTSANAFYNVSDKEIFKKHKVAVIGESTAMLIEKQGVQADFISKKADSESFSRLFADYLIENQVDAKVVLLKGSSATNIFAEGLEQKQISCHQETVYEVKQVNPHQDDIDAVIRCVEDEESNVALCATSSFALSSFCEIIKKHTKYYHNLPVYVIGPKTAETANKLGFKNCIQSKSASVESLAELFSV